jgi:predicted DNA-binding transcriptional regulator AlpA
MSSLDQGLQPVLSEAALFASKMTTLSRQLRTQSQPRRGLRREEAAAYLGFSARKFDELIADGRMPKPKRIDGVVVWDIHRLDLAFDALPEEGGDGGANAWG